MSDPVLMEEPLQFGNGGRLFGILTLPGRPFRSAPALPVFVFLSAGLLHRVGPYRLHVRLARELAHMGFGSLRVDLAGKGDTPPRAGSTNQQSVAADYEEIQAVLKRHLGHSPLVLAGLCSGADNAIRLTRTDPRVIGMVLLDPICFPDPGFRMRGVIAKYSNPARYVAWLGRRRQAHRVARGGVEQAPDPLALRDLPSRDQMRAAFDSVRARRGQVLSVFTDGAHAYYNQAGQLGRVLGVDEYDRFCKELHWPQADHTFSLERHRRRLMDEIKTWAGAFRHAPLSDNEAGAVSSPLVESGREGGVAQPASYDEAHRAVRASQLSADYRRTR